MPAVDPYGSYANNPHGCFDHAKEITPSDTADLSTVASFLMSSTGTGGNFRVTTVGGETVTIYSFNGNLPLRCTRVWATGTTVAGIVALW